MDVYNLYQMPQNKSFVQRLTFLSAFAMNIKVIIAIVIFSTVAYSERQ